MATPSGAYQITRAAAAYAQQNVIQVGVPIGTMAEVTRAWTSQSTITASGQTGMTLMRKSAAASVGTAATPTPQNPNMVASRCIGGAALTAIDLTTNGTDGVTLYQDGFNVVNGWLYLPVPEERATSLGAAATFLAMKYIAAPAAASYSNGIEWLEY